MIGGGDVAEALGRQLKLSMSAVPGAWHRERATVSASVAGVAVAGFNAVTPRAAAADLDEVAELLDLVAATRLPHCLQARPSDGRRVASLTEARGMRYVDGLPFYVREGRADGDGADVDVLALSPEQAGVHAEVAGVGFGLGHDLFATLVTPQTLALEGVRAYAVLDATGRAVATGLAVTIGPATGISNVATLPEARGQGLATAITARIVRDGLAEGARWSYLASTPEGAGVYERLGFAAVERWACWESV